jgi:hypothetical protein
VRFEVEMDQLARRLTVLEPIREHAQRQSLRVSDRLALGRSVGEHTRKIDDLGDPAPSSSRSISIR